MMMLKECCFKVAALLVQLEWDGDHFPERPKEPFSLVP